MASAEAIDSAALAGLRRRGQFLISSLLWASAAGLLLLVSAYVLVLYHYALVIAERLRAGLGLQQPQAGPDVFLLGMLAAGPLFMLLILATGWTLYRRVWNRKLREIWPDSKERNRFGAWRRPPSRAAEPDRQHKAEYLSKLTSRTVPPGDYEHHAEVLLDELDRDIAERALATGLIVGISHSRFIDLFTIFTATLELQLHVLTRLGKRPSWHTWRLLIQRCAASLFINSYLNRQETLMLNLLIKKAGMGLNAAGDAMEHMADSDMDLDEALNMQHGGILGIATKGLELGATMSLTVGQVGLHALAGLIESVGDELLQGSLAAGIIYYHGISLAADTLALDQLHRRRPAMTRSVRDAIWKMGEVAGSILLDFIRARRNAFRERRQQLVRSLPKTAYEKIQSLFGRKTAAEPDPAGH